MSDKQKLEHLIVSFTNLLDNFQNIFLDFAKNKNKTKHICEAD